MPLSTVSAVAEADRAGQALAARAAGAAQPLRAPPPGRARPRRRQEARPHPARRRAPRHRAAHSQPDADATAAGAGVARLGVRARLRRRRHPPGLRRSARTTRRRMTAGRLSAPWRRVVRRARRHRRAVMSDNGSAYRATPTRSPPRARPAPPAHPALPAAHQRESRALHPHLEFPRFSGHLTTCAAVARKDGVSCRRPDPRIPRSSVARRCRCCVPAARRASWLRASACREQTLRNWRRQDQLDRHERDDGLTSDEREELRRLRRENAAAEAGARSAQTSRGLLREGDRDPVSGLPVDLGGEGPHPGLRGLPLLGVSRSGYYEWARARRRTGRSPTRG